jgi:hypothetical protein
MLSNLPRLDTNLRCNYFTQGCTILQRTTVILSFAFDNLFTMFRRSADTSSLAFHYLTAAEEAGDSKEPPHLRTERELKAF